jgi:hypothetical protein
MVTKDDRMKVLKMVQDGKITPEEGLELLTMVDEEPTPGSAMASTGNKGRWMHIRVSNMDTNMVKVNVRLPIGLVNAGMKLGARFSPEIDQDQLAPLLEGLKDGETGRYIDVFDEEDREHVEIFVE